VPGVPNQQEVTEQTEYRFNLRSLRCLLFKTVCCDTPSCSIFHLLQSEPCSTTNILCPIVEESAHCGSGTDTPSKHSSLPPCVYVGEGQRSLSNLLRNARELLKRFQDMLVLVVPCHSVKQQLKLLVGNGALSSFGHEILDGFVKWLPVRLVTLPLSTMRILVRAVVGRLPDDHPLAKLGDFLCQRAHMAQLF